MEKIIADQDLVITALNYKDGDTVTEGAEIIQTEILKMMIPIHCRTSGIIQYHVQPYDYVGVGTIMAEIISAS